MEERGSSNLHATLRREVGLPALSRVLLAMARRGDAPALLARIDRQRASPVASVWACGALIAVISLFGDVRTTWSFSAFTAVSRCPGGGPA